MIGHLRIDIHRSRVWEQAPSGKWYSRTPTLEDHQRRREWLAEHGPDAIRSELDERVDTN